MVNYISKNLDNSIFILIFDRNKNLNPHNMRHLTYLLFAFFLITSISCTKDEDFRSTESSGIIDEIKNEEPCTIDLNSIESNETILIGCNLDLNGQTISLPENTKIQYNGGSVTNGKLIFNGGLIDGQLLNISLEIEGSARIIDTNYSFDFTKWNITEGVVTTAVALSNRENMNLAITQVKYLRGYTFEIDNIDAYFEIGAIAFGNTAHREAVQIPSDFHFKMGNNCHLRAQPNGQPAYAILSARKAINIKITGGHLYGDKFEHTYTQGIDYKMHDSGYGVYFRGVRNSIVDGVTMENFTGDGFNCHGIGRRNNDGTVPTGMEENFCEYLVIKNCTFDANRRNNISIIDGTNITVEDNTFLKAGETANGENPQGTNGTAYSWRGIVPANGIDFEAWRPSDENGAYDTQFIDQVIVRNNIFRGGNKADINLYTCSNIEIYDNDFDSSISNLNSSDILIHDNIFNNNLTELHQTAIVIKEFIRSGTGLDENINHKVYNNTISGYTNGIRVGGTDGKFYNNTITGFRNGIYFTNGENNLVHDNTLISQILSSKGYYNFPGGIKAKNILVKNDYVSVDKYPLSAKKINLDEENTENGITFDNISFNSANNTSILLFSSENITIKNSSYNGLNQTNCSDITLTNNN